MPFFVVGVVTSSHQSSSAMALSVHSSRPAAEAAARERSGTADFRVVEAESRHLAEALAVSGSRAEALRTIEPERERHRAEFIEVMRRRAAEGDEAARSYLDRMLDHRMFGPAEDQDLEGWYASQAADLAARAAGGDFIAQQALDQVRAFGVELPEDPPGEAT